MHVHPLTGEPKQNGKAMNGHARPEVASFFQRPPGERRAKLSFDAARTGTDLDGHWAFADSLDSDSANSQSVRHTLMRRQRYEAGSNGIYAGIVRTHCNMLVGVGPNLRMLTGNRAFNQFVEKEFFKWAQGIQLRRKLWCMAHSRTGDGESFGILQTNPATPEDQVQLDLTLIEAEQCQTPYMPWTDGYIDGIKFDALGNVEWYDVLPYHPGSASMSVTLDAIRVSPSDMVHWFKLERPGAHRSKPELTSSLNCGAVARRMREGTVKSLETAASIGALMTTSLAPAGDSEADPVAPFTSMEWVHKMLMAAPMGWDVKQLKGEHPNAQYGEFNRTLISEQARPISMPYNAAACDSSTYSFASGKLDTLCYRAALDVERADANDLVLDRIFAAWFREWTTVIRRRDIPPAHQWDWPCHPVIDVVQEASAVTANLQNGTTTQRQVFSDKGQDYEDQLVIMAEDWFGEASEENIAKARQIQLIRNVPQAAVQAVAQIIGLVLPTAPSFTPGAPA